MDSEFLRPVVKEMNQRLLRNYVTYVLLGLVCWYGFEHNVSAAIMAILAFTFHYAIIAMVIAHNQMREIIDDQRSIIAKLTITVAKQKLEAEDANDTES